MHGTHQGGSQFRPTHGLRVRRLGSSMNLGVHTLNFISMQIKFTHTQTSVSRVWLSSSKLPGEIQVLVMQIACLEAGSYECGLNTIIYHIIYTCYAK